MFDNWSVLKFLLRDALQCKVRSFYRMPSVRLTVCLWVTLVDHGHIGWKSWKLIARAYSPTSSFFVAHRSSTNSQGNMEKFLGRLEVGWEKVGCWSTKAATYLKCVKIEEKLLCRVYKKSPTLFQFFGSPPIFLFYFRFCLYGHRDGRFCLIFAHTAHHVVIFAIAQLSCSFCRCLHCMHYV